MTRPTVVVLCNHGEAKPHYIDWTTPTGAPHDCPGGRVLEQAIIIERDKQTINRFEVIDHTSNGQGRILSKWEDFDFHVAFDSQDGGRTLKVFLSHCEDALASAQENQQERATLQRGLDDLKRRSSDGLQATLTEDRDHR